ncbi:MAG: alpha/beta fold hydrolase [Gammaproteobacteria bacterium]
MERHITDAYTEYRFGAASDGDQTWYYVPNQLKYGDHAPVVVFLHGFAALYPSFYQSHIEHLLAQGNIVIFPQFQKATLTGFLSEAGLGQAADQNLWARRAVETTAEALDLLGDAADRDEIYLYGHSLGGLITLAASQRWRAGAGAGVESPASELAGRHSAIRAVVSENHRDPWREYAASITAPVIILNGDEDIIAPVSQSEEILSLVTAAPSAVLYVAQRDRYGYPFISPNHGAPLDAIPGLPPHLKVSGVSAELDVLDWRFYFAGLDAVMDGYRSGLPFDLGNWSNGRPVKPVLERTALDQQ